MSAFDPKYMVTSGSLVDYLIGCVVDDDGRLEVLKLGLASKSSLDSFLKLRSMLQLCSLDAFPIINRSASTRPFIKQECLTSLSAANTAAQVLRGGRWLSVGFSLGGAGRNE